MEEGHGVMTLGLYHLIFIIYYKTLIQFINSWQLANTMKIRL